MPINKNSLQAKINNLSQKKGVHQNILLKSFFFDAFLKRLAASKYSENFVFKGGFLLSTSLGIDLRSTVDIDFLIRKTSLARDNILKIFEEVSKIDVEDGINFEINDIEEIRKEDDYGGLNVTLIGHLENIKEIVSVDVATGDPITPNPISYQYKSIFNDEILNFKAYNFETILAEKLQTILTRGVTNSRSKDFYDLYIVHKLKWETINLDVLKEAFVNTCKYRNTQFLLNDVVTILTNIKNNSMMKTRWGTYRKRNQFVGDIEFDDTVDIALLIAKTIYE